MNLIEGNKFDIKSLENIIEQFERDIEKTKAKPKTKKRTKYIADLESRIKYRQNIIRTLEIEIELEEIKGTRIHGMEGIEALEAIEKVMEINSWINDLGSNELDKLKILKLNWDK